MDVRSLIEALLQYDLDDDVDVRIKTDNGSDMAFIEDVGYVGCKGGTVYIEIDLKGYDL
ncbi:hypothetical protein [Virgibacillus proomii]|uniref:hypothetical protein n=1 Tax=Virgibacillus proomii TaxID=84407 RepID=UPI0015C3D022|nr:hypothetical protein [Virgibacillus proomii]